MKTIGQKIEQGIEKINISQKELADTENPINNSEPILNKKDEKDIAKSLNKTLKMLESRECLTLSGELVDEQDFELIKIAIQNGLEYAKINNKKKFTPKKFR